MYMEEGTGVGSETDESAWTQFYDADVTSPDDRNSMTISLPVLLAIKAGKCRGFYVSTSGNNRDLNHVRAGSQSSENDHIRIFTGNRAGSQFGSVILFPPATYVWVGSVIYSL
mmetsp:Transcript_12932/g.30099  ORF Transcript_12932/g.30099 Transcript_12932/m.30099 type:complete len:113 (-) Transcript_12932:251-589(-)